MKTSIIAAVAWDRSIGQKGKMPWQGVEHLKEASRADLKRFKEMTLGYPVVMGRKTFESILERSESPNRPLRSGHHGLNSSN